MPTTRLIAIYAPTYDANNKFGRMALELVWHWNQMNSGLNDLLELEKLHTDATRKLLAKETLSSEEQQHLSRMAEVTKKAGKLAETRLPVSVNADGATPADFAHTYSPAIAKLLDVKTKRPADGILVLGKPEEIAQYPVQGLAAYTSVSPGEALSREAIKKLTKCRVVLVPAAWQVDELQRQGVMTDIRVVRPGISENFIYVERKQYPEVFVWLTDQAQTLALSVFKEAFGNSPKHRLLMINGKDDIKGANVDVIRQPATEREWQLLFSQVHAMAYPTHGVGFGWLPRAATRTGLPVIATDAFGTADELVQWGFKLPCKTRLREAQPDRERLKYLMDYISSEKRFNMWHQLPGKQSERVAAKVSRLYDWQTCAYEIYEAVENAVQRGPRQTIEERRANRRKRQKVNDGNGSTENEISA